ATAAEGNTVAVSPGMIANPGMINLLYESHRRKSVDRSSPAYRRKSVESFNSGLLTRQPTILCNPPDGSGWIVQIRPTHPAGDHSLQSHRRKSVDRSSPAYPAIGRI